MSKAKLPVRRLGDVCRVQKGKVITEKETTAGQVPVVAGGSKPAYFHNVSNRDPGTITISASGYAGFVSYWGVPIWASDCITVEPLDPTTADSPYLFHALKYLEPSVLRSLQRGAAQKHVYAKDIQEIELPVPTIDEQRRIASILDAADALREKRRQAIEKLDALDMSLAEAMFDQYPGANALGSHITFLTSGARGWAKHYADSGARFIRSIDVRMNSISVHDAVFVDAPSSAESRRIMVNSGDVLLTITGSRIGRAAEVRPDLAGSYVSQHVAIIRVDPSALTPGYLSLWLCHPSFGQRQIASKQYGQTKPGLNFEQIRSFSLPVPPLDAQQQLLDEVSQVGRIRSVGKVGDTRLDSLFASLQHRAFRGEL